MTGRSGNRALDLVLYGATGLVGTLTARYLASTGSAMSIGLAGRSEPALTRLRDGLGSPARNWTILRAHSGDPQSLREMAASARLVVSAAGPYADTGLPVVSACVAVGTEYVDIAGETLFIRDSAHQFHDEAASKNLRIVHSCGFDSLPSDLSVYLLHRRAAQDGTGSLVETNHLLFGQMGNVSAGTIASAIQMLRRCGAHSSDRRDLLDAYTLTPDRPSEPDLGEQPDWLCRAGRAVAPEVSHVQTTAFALAIPNSRIVRRSNALQNWAYGRNLRYTESVALTGSRVSALIARLLYLVIRFGFGVSSRTIHRWPNRLVDVLPAIASVARRRYSGSYRVETYATTSENIRYRAIFEQDGDPGSHATSVLLAESALAMLESGSDESRVCGVLTPAVAIGQVLPERLSRAGLTLRTQRLSPEHTAAAGSPEP
ncbi:saccharopine dehydrogenase family protein [Nocardia sp. CA-129566]|uniref:saccharopine dehydrogenase family protein n=1 Tax=Nocardia sp. CA-129566 TaxID=3239976 RepID=UPI003D97FC5A